MVATDDFALWVVAKLEVLDQAVELVGGGAAAAVAEDGELAHC